MTTIDAFIPFRDALVAACEALPFVVDDARTEPMFHHYAQMVAANAQFNLTRVTDPVEAAVKHYADSLSLAAWLQAAGARATPAATRIRTMLDIGSGAGFPAVPIAIACPHLSITAIDGTSKKIRFIQAFIQAARLANLTAIHARSEHWSTPERFDLVAARALAPADRCLAWAAPLMAAGGRIALFKTATLDKEEEAGLGRAIRRLGLVEHDRFPYELRVGPEVLRRALRVFGRVQPD